MKEEINDEGRETMREGGSGGMRKKTERQEESGLCRTIKKKD